MLNYLGCKQALGPCYAFLSRVCCDYCGESVLRQASSEVMPFAVMGTSPFSAEKITYFYAFLQGNEAKGSCAEFGCKTVKEPLILVAKELGVLKLEVTEAHLQQKE